MHHTIAFFLKLSTGFSRIRSLSWRLIFASGLFLSLPACGENNRMHVNEFSFVNNPALSNGMLHTNIYSGVKVWSLTLEAQFANECLAAAGATAHYIDNHGLRILIVQQNISPSGCPDIYQPKEKKLRIDIPVDNSINKILLMNHFGIHHDWLREYQVSILEADNAITTSITSSHQLIPLRSLANAALPVLSNLTVSTMPSNRYAIAFDLKFTSSCEANSEIETYIMESRSDPDNPEQNIFHDWLLIFQPGSTVHCTKTEETVIRHFELNRNYHPHYKRQLLILNPLSLDKWASGKPFTIIPVR